MSNLQAKAQLDKIIDTFNSVVSYDNIDRIIDLLSKQSLDLVNNLSSGNLYVDQDVIDKMKDVMKQLEPGSSLIATAKAYQKAKKPGPGGGVPLDGAGKTYGITVPAGVAHDRHEEYDKLTTYAGYFNLKDKLDDVKTTFFHTPQTATDDIDLNAKFKSAGPDPEYELCDAEGNVLVKDGGGHTITISGTDYDAADYKVKVGGEEYVLRDVMMKDNHLYFGAMKIEPPLASGTVELSINAKYKSGTVGVPNVNVVCNKKFNLVLDDGVHKLDNTEREAVFDEKDNKKEIKGRLMKLYTERKETIEKNFLDVYLAGNALYTSMLNENDKDVFYRSLLKDKRFTQIYKDLSILKDEQKFSEFKQWFIDDNRKWNKGIKSNEEYFNVILANIGSFEGFISDTLGTYITKNAGNLGFIVAYLNEFANKKRDAEKTAAKNIVRDVCSSARSYTMESKGLFHRDDTNYMRFFADSSASINSQKVKVDRGQEITYDMNMAISGERKINVEFTVDGSKLPVSGGEPSAIVRKIMRSDSVENGIVRAHMCFNVYKAMVKMAKTRNLSLECSDGGDVVSIDLESDNIVIKSKTGKVVFDQRNFIVGSGDAEVIGALELRQGVEKLSKYFNLAMNNVHKEYHTAVRKGLLKPNLPTTFRNAPVEKLLHGKNLKDVVFDTTINTPTGDVSVSFEKNKFTVNMAGLEKPIVSKNLGKILERRDKKGNRIFGGKERDIIQGVYVALIDELKKSILRKNEKLGDFHYGVIDDTSGDLYVLDNTGKYWKVNSKDVPGVKSELLSGKKFGTIKETGMYRMTALTGDKENEIKKNPILMQRFVKAMKKRMGLIETLSN